MPFATSLKLHNPFSPTSAATGRRDLDFPAAVSPARRLRNPPRTVAMATVPTNDGAPWINGHPHINGHAHSYAPALAPHVAFQGAPGAYSEFAAKTAVPGCATVPCRTFSDAIAAVQAGQADRAILPVESTMEGTALRNYDLLLRHDLVISQEVNLFVHYCLLAMPGVRPAELRRVISHPMALAHCGRALAQLGLHRREPVEDTAGAVEMLRSHRLLDTAAIASPRAALLYGLDVLADGLQDESWNVTRFLLLSPKSSTPPLLPPNPKTSMVIAHRGGSMVVLLKVLSAFSRRNINLTKLEIINSSASENKAPVMILDIRGKGSLRAFPQILYVDFEGSTEDPRVKEAIDEISQFSVFVRILGCYAANPNVYDLQ
ncbi:hypothetical protein OPV22_002932 [Ensete ventricosum]|uniref:arogenate dehydratase n=1 Tax=Ensete ventricosum TaxID=4639 RepID=A0AAV8RZF9_ENSVE|nr:hypothetical protein OPV22_002932 [Ensete ventricosum]